MQHPLQAILIAGEIARDDIIRGHKTTTIRNGFRAYRKGEVVMIGCHILNWCVMKTIIDVQQDLPYGAWNRLFKMKINRG